MGMLHLKLWVNAIFGPLLWFSPPAGLPRGIDGPRLCYLNRDVCETTTVIDEFYFFFKHLDQLSFSDTRGMNLSPYSSRPIGLVWFTHDQLKPRYIMGT